MMDLLVNDACLWEEAACAVHGNKMDVLHSSLMSCSYEERNQTSRLLTREHLEPILCRNWKAVLVWATFLPQEVATLLDSKGNSSLHHVCLYKAPAHVIEALLYAAPDLATWPNHEKEFPIHWCVRLDSPDEALRLILKASPTCGGTCFNESNQTAISLLFDRYRNTFSQLLLPFEYSCNEKEASTIIQTSEKWRRIMLLTRACHYKSVDMALTARPELDLHCILGVDCKVLFNFAIQWGSKMAQERDEEGRLPLHIAVTMSYTSTETLRELLRRFPKAAKIVDAGRLPLVAAILSGKTWENGVQLLLEAEPRALSTRERLSGLYPFALAATITSSETHKSIADVDTIFQLLKAGPECIRSL